MQSTRYIVTSCHGNDDEMWSTSCLIMQHKPYIVELSFMETPMRYLYHCMMSHVETIGQNLSLISNYILPIPVICLIAWHSYTYSEEHPSTLDHSLCNGCSHMYLLYLPLHLHCEINIMLIEICHLYITKLCPSNENEDMHTCILLCSDI